MGDLFEALEKQQEAARQRSSSTLPKVNPVALKQTAKQYFKEVCVSKPGALALGCLLLIDCEMKAVCSICRFSVRLLK